MKDSLCEIEKKYDSLNDDLRTEEVLSDIKKYTKITKEINNIKSIALTFKKYLECEKNIEDSKLLLNEKDSEIVQLAKNEIIENEKMLETLYEELKVLLLSKDENDDKDVIIEIRGAAGGDEANIFAGDLYKIYSKFSESNNWKVKLIDASYASAVLHKLFFQ